MNKKTATTIIVILVLALIGFAPEEVWDFLLLIWIFG